MKRRVISLILSLVLVFGLSTTAGAYTNKQLQAADALNHLDLFRGVSTTSKVYKLDDGFKRYEGTILLLRMIGEETEAEAVDQAENPFTDVTDWTVPYLTYAWKTGVVNGTSSTTFAPADSMSDYMFLTLVLRVLGYEDGNKPDEENTDFYFKEPYALAKQLGMITSAAADEEFTRGDAVVIFWNALSIKFKGTGETLSARLISEGVFTAAEYAEAKEIWTYGSIQEDDDGDDASSAPSVPSAPAVPDDGKVTYGEYNAMTGAEQMAFIQSFDSMEAFFDWLYEAQAAYEANHPDIEIGDDGSVDLTKQG